ncbi:winged helix-turn-helix domain-containing protein [Actinoplanes philippinensis]|uniref:winged helix-turn-helix domain-containing protein n=1 Tax=Actinoplanes philippinensis TaxID=35752 RepID=UPI0033EC8DD7
MNDGTSAVALRFEMLGPIRAYRGTEQVDLGPPKQQAVLALLLLHAPRPVPVEQIVAALWNGDPPPNGIDVVQRFIGALRRGLDPERTSLITLTDGGYVIRAGETAVDTGVFRAALARAHAEHQTGTIGAATDEIRTALGLWQAEPLTGLSGPVFDSARARLNSERAAASALLAEPLALASPGPPPAATTPFPGPAPEPAQRPIPATRPFPGPAPEPAQRPIPATRPFPGPAPEPAREPLPATRPFPKPAKPEPEPENSAYPDAVDPWEGHDLFPPDPLSMN